MHEDAPTGGSVDAVSEAVRQLPGVRNCHHAGSVVPAKLKRTNASIWYTPATGDESMNVQASCSLPDLVSQAKERLVVPPSP
jgi:hypothetical protein